MEITDDRPGDNRPPVYWESNERLGSGDDLIIRASALGTSCLWELCAAGQGYDPGLLPESLLRAFAEGNEAEPRIIARLEREHGFVFRSHQEEADWEVEEGLVVRHHPDGIAELGKPFLRHIRVLTDMVSPTTYPWGELAVVEIKYLSDALWQKFVSQGMGEVIEEYKWQGSVMMQYHGIPLLWVAENKGLPIDPETGERPPCPDRGKLHFQWVDHKPVSEDELVEKARRIREGCNW